MPSLKIRVLFPIVAVSCFLLSGIMFPAGAQSLDLSLGISPELPQTSESVTAILSSFSLDLDRVRIAWRLNGVLQKSAIGEKRFQFVAGKIGERLTLEATVEPGSGELVRRSVTIQPQEVDILWYAFSYIPPFYKGAALPASEAVVKITALPEMVNANGTRLSPANLVYAWEQDGVALGSVSGFGKRSITIRGKTIAGDTTTVTVTVSSINKKVQGRKTTLIETAESKVLVYEKHPLLGVLFGRTLKDSLFFGEQETTLRAEPFFFSLEDIARGKLHIQWSFNRDLVSEGKDITLGEKDVSETSKITLDVINEEKVLQDTRATFTINF